MFIARVTPPIDAEIVELERRMATFRATHAAAQPTMGELMGRAVEGTDFLGDIDRNPQILAAVAANAADVAASSGRRTRAGRCRACRSRRSAMLPRR